MRILFADNAPDFLKTRADFLRSRGYEVVEAGGVDEAERLLNEGWVHLAILDIRLADDGDDKDVSGLIIAKKEAYRPVPKVILTGFPSYQQVREALGPTAEGLPPAVSFVAKQEGLEAMLRAVESAFSGHVRINWGLKTRWRQPLSFRSLAELIEGDAGGSRSIDRGEELEDLFRKLFYEHTHIAIGRLLARDVKAVILEVFAYRDEGHEGETIIEEQFLVACGQRQRIGEENGRYNALVPRGSGAGSTEMRKTAETLRFGATAYTLTGGDLEEITTFREFYQAAAAAEVSAALDYLFQATLAPWHEQARGYVEDRPMSDRYSDWAQRSGELLPGIELERRAKALCQEITRVGRWRLDYTPHELVVHPPDGPPIGYPNPVHYLYAEHPAPGSADLHGIIHGQVDPDRILADRHGHTWLCDFTNAGRGPLVRDFARLESAIRIELCPAPDLEARHRQDETLLASAALDDGVTTSGVAPDVEKTLRAVERIRHAAAGAVGRDIPPYLAALLFCAMGRLAGYDPGMRYTRRELIPYAHSLLLAAMLCAKLAALGKTLPHLPEEAMDGLWVDEANKEVWVEGRRVDVTPQEFNILAYLYERAGRLCDRRAIVAEALGSECDNRFDEEGRLNSAMSRLRQKIEPDPDNPKYVDTVRARGYKLLRRAKPPASQVERPRPA